MKELVLSLDLEMNQPSGRIIQIGAVIGNVKTGEIIDRFSGFANPLEELAPVIIELTGITQAEVDSAPLLHDTYAKFLEWAAPHKNKRHLNPITWGGGDSEYLRSQLELELDSRDWVMGRRWLDAKTVFVAWSMAQGKTPRTGLGASMKVLGMQFEGRAHNATVDAENTFEIWRKLMSLFKGTTLN